MPTARTELGVAADASGHIYAFGGSSGSDVNSVEMYDPATDSWTTKSPMPAALHSMGVAFDPVNSKFYVGGGRDNSGIVNGLYEYDPSTDTWVQKASIPSPYNDQIRFAAAPNGKIYAIGGDNGFTYATNVEEYDPTTDTWTSKSALPPLQASGALVTALNGEIYASSAGSTLFAAYDPTTDTWTTKAPTPVQLGDGGVSLDAAGDIVLAGGYLSNGTFSNVVEQYNPTTDTWTVGTSLPFPTVGMRTALGNDGNIHALGGQTLDDPEAHTNYAGISSTTVTFDDQTANHVLNGTYAGITWSSNVWDVDGPITSDSTNSISFHSSTVTGGTFSFVSPQVLLSTQIESNSNMTAMITLSCAGNPTIDAQVAPGATATLTTGWQTPCTTVTVTSSNSWNTNLDNLVYSSIPNPGTPPSLPPPPSGQTFGYPIQGALLDTGDANYMNGSKFTTGATGGTAQSMSVFVGNVDSGSHNQYQLAIYSDNHGKPGTLLAHSATGTLTPLSWNTLSISATLQPNTTYWLMYNTNATTSTNYLNNLYFDPGAQGVAAWAKHAFGSWPTTFPTPTLDTTQFSMCVIYH